MLESCRLGLCAAVLSAVLVVAGSAAAANSKAGSRMTPEKAEHIRQTMAPKAKKGDANAEYNMGVLYANGYGVDKNYKKARQWYEKAAAQHHAKAEQNLGILYLKGQGVERDVSKAAHWFERAARDGEPAAENNLSVLYARGDGVPQDYAQAAMWAARAAKAGNAQAGDNLPKLIAKLPKRYVRNDDAPLRSQPNAQTHATKRLAANTQVVRLDGRDDWSRVLLPATHRIGWLQNKQLAKDKRVVTTAQSKAKQQAKQQAKTSTDQSKTGVSTQGAGRGHAVTGADAHKTVAASSVNVHDKPERSAHVIFQAKRGMKIRVKRSWRGWRLARFPNGKDGWIAAYLLAG